MKLRKVILKNFKAFKEAEFNLDDISIIIGKNDAGKSTVLQALNLFFNPKDVKKEGLFYKNSGGIAESISIECHFSIGNQNEITLGGEDKGILITETNLLNKSGYFVLGYKYTEKSISSSPFIADTYIKCYNYDISKNEYPALFNKKQVLELMKKEELNKAIKDLNLVDSKPSNAHVNENHWKRKSLENYLTDNGLKKEEMEINIVTGKNKEDRLEPIIAKLPKFKLFSNDKANASDEKTNSKLIQDEIEEIIKSEMQSEINKIKEEIEKKMSEKMSKLNNPNYGLGKK